MYTPILFLHIMSAIIWIGGMIVVRGVVYPILQNIQDDSIRIPQILAIINRLFQFVLPFIFFLIITGTLMANKGFVTSFLKPFIYVKEGIWTLMLINFILMYFKHKKVEEIYQEAPIEAKSELRFISFVLLPLNIFFGISAIFFGVALRGIF